MFRSAYPEAVQAEEMTDPSMNDVQIPVAPGSQPPQLEEPTTPVAPLDPKAEAARHRPLVTGRPTGPTLLQDHRLREKVSHLDHERISERVMHARGAATNNNNDLPTWNCQ